MTTQTTTPDTVDICKAIKDYLQNTLKCAVRERNGIWYVRTPNGEMWDFTEPKLVGEKSRRTS